MPPVAVMQRADRNVFAIPSERKRPAMARAVHAYWVGFAISGVPHETIVLLLWWDRTSAMHTTREKTKPPIPIAKVAAEPVGGLG
jgi:hypothetical protein